MAESAIVAIRNRHVGSIGADSFFHTRYIGSRSARRFIRSGCPLVGEVVLSRSVDSISNKVKGLPTKVGTKIIERLLERAFNIVPLSGINRGSNSGTDQSGNGAGKVWA